jgi:hypothetical protein
VPPARIVALQHGGQGDNPHRDFCCPNDTHHRSQRCGRDDRCRSQSATEPTQDLVDHVEEFLDDTRAFEHGRHENKEWNGRELIVGHEGEDARRYDVEHRRIPEHKKKNDAQSPRDESQWQSRHEENDEGAEKQERKPADADLESHGSGLSNR